MSPDPVHDAQPATWEQASATWQRLLAQGEAAEAERVRKLWSMRAPLPAQLSEGTSS